MRLVTAALLLLLAGCGQSGALYFAEPEVTADRPAKAPAAEDDDTEPDHRP